jgi:hypothetical protein
VRSFARALPDLQNRTRVNTSTACRALRQRQEREESRVSASHRHANSSRAEQIGRVDISIAELRPTESHSSKHINCPPRASTTPGVKEEQRQRLASPRKQLTEQNRLAESTFQSLSSVLRNRTRVNTSTARRALRQRQERERRAEPAPRFVTQTATESVQTNAHIHSFIHSQELCLFCRIALELIHQLPAARFDNTRRERRAESAPRIITQTAAATVQTEARIHSARALPVLQNLSLELIHQLPAARFDSVRRERGEQSQRLASSRKQQQSPFRQTRAFIRTAE